MKWYTDYLSAYEKPYSELPPPLTNRVKKESESCNIPILWFQWWSLLIMKKTEFSLAYGRYAKITVTFP